MKHSCWIVCAVAVLIVGFVGLGLLAQAPDPLIGTWELNVAKSTFKAGQRIKSSTRKFEAVPNGFKYSGQSIRDDGMVSGSQWTAYFDGKDYPVTGDPASDTILLKRIDRFNTDGTFKKAGKVVSHVTRVVPQDGKIWTLTTEGTDAQGKPYSYVLVFDKK